MRDLQNVLIHQECQAAASHVLSISAEMIIKVGSLYLKVDQEYPS